MKKNNWKRAAGALALAFMLAASPTGSSPAEAARNTEPASCKTGGRTYNPQSASITVDAQSGVILSGDRIDQRLPPASMTKMMTAALIFEALRDGRLKLDDEVTVRHSPAVMATRGDSNSTWLREGATITVREAILAIGVASANNVAAVMAEHLAGDEAAFVALMNEKARALGMSNTVFRNPHGLPDDAQVSTARDMAKLALHLLREYPDYYKFFSTPRAEFGPYRGSAARRNHNELDMRNNHIDGIKTGFICASGYNLAASGIRNGERVVTIVFGGRTAHQRNERARTLIDSGLRVLQRERGAPEGEHIEDDTKPPPAPAPSSS